MQYPTYCISQSFIGCTCVSIFSMHTLQLEAACLIHPSIYPFIHWYKSGTGITSVGRYRVANMPSNVGRKEAYCLGLNCNYCLLPGVCWRSGFQAPVQVPRLRGGAQYHEGRGPARSCCFVVAAAAEPECFPCQEFFPVSLECVLLA
jgi:hypothetical protein